MRTDLDSRMTTSIIPNPSRQSPMHGTLKYWNIYLARPGTVHLQIWRQLSKSGHYQLVHSANATFSGNISGIQTVTPSNDVMVQRFDVMGLSWTAGQNPVPYTSTVCYDGNRQLYSHGHVTWVVGSQMKYTVDSSSSHSCRQYSVFAYVKPTANASVQRMEVILALCQTQLFVG